jgi:hypothetical protein
MRPFVLPFLLAIILCRCAGGSSVSAPTAPSLSPTSSTQPTLRDQPSLPADSSPSVLVIALVVSTTLTANQPTTFIASARPSANGTLDFGDGTQVVDFVLDKDVNVTLAHTYTRSGTFVATFTATNASGQSASLPTTITVR